MKMGKHLPKYKFQLINVFCFLLLNTILPISNSLAQSTWEDELLKQTPVECQDIPLNVVNISKRFIEENKLDSLLLLTDYWEAYCGLSEPVYRLRVLTKLIANSFEEEMIDVQLMDFVRAFEDRQQIKATSKLKIIYTNIYQEELGYIELGGEFDQFTEELADQLLNEVPTETNQFMVALVYSGQRHMFGRYLIAHPYRDLTFNKVYQTHLKEVTRKLQRYEIWVLKIWVPFFAQEEAFKSREKVDMPEWDKKITLRTRDCRVRSRSLSELVVENVRIENFEKVEAILGVWESCCGLTEPIYRLQNHLKLEKGKLTEGDLEKRFFDYMENFELRVNPDFEHYSKNPHFLPDETFTLNNEISEDFDQELLIWARKLNQNFDRNSLEYRISLFYSGDIDGFYQTLQNADEEDFLVNQYRLDIQETDKYFDAAFSFSIGAFTPFGNLSLVGAQPMISFHVGFTNDKNKIDFVAAGTLFNKSKNSYETVHQGQLKSTDHFNYFSLGLESTNAILHSNKGQIQWLSGIGLAQITTVKIDQENEVPARLSYSPYFSYGIGFQTFGQGGSFASLQILGNHTFFRNHGGTNLSGGFFHTRLLINFSKTKNRWNRRTALRVPGV